MYFPYLRGKQYEWIAIRELSPLIAENEAIIPIIEPVKKNFSNLRRSVEIIKKSRAPLMLIVNPQVGELANYQKTLIREIDANDLRDYENAHFAYVVNNNTKIRDIDNFFDEFDECSLNLIHNSNFPNTRNLNNCLNECDSFNYNIFIENNTGRKYRRSFPDIKKVIIEDGFEKRRNVDYPDEEFFSDLHSVFFEEGFDGFGDYLIVGDNYSETGGPAHAVAIHLTYLDDEDDIWIKHFVSDTTGDPVDPAGKFLEALDKVIRYLESDDNKIYPSNACEELIALHEEERFPGLGYVKKLSMKHHIELISTEIS